MKLSAFDFALPDSLIAQHPLPERDQSRLMLVDRASGSIDHRSFADLPEILSPEHFIVLNSTRVFPARLWATRPGKRGQIEVLLVRELAPGDWLALVRPGRRAGPGQELAVGPLRAWVGEARQDGSRVLRFENAENLTSALENIGHTPLPHYIRRPKGQCRREDKERYQTVFAKHTGSIAAPTAGLHFTQALFRRLDSRGVGRCEILLHVGYGTFKPVRSENIEDHRMDAEYFEISGTAAACIRQFRSENRKLVAVGTTTTRALEYLGQVGGIPAGGASGFCDLFIYPGFRFRVLDGLLTNFHLPRSSLFLLVCAFAGRELMMEAYGKAVRRSYRFFSYGDCMLIL